MPRVTKVNGTVMHVNRQGSLLTALVRFPIDPPPPEFEEKLFEVSKDDRDDLRAALADDLKVDVTYDDGVTPPTPTGIKVHK